MSKPPNPMGTNADIVVSTIPPRQSAITTGAQVVNPNYGASFSGQAKQGLHDLQINVMQAVGHDTEVASSINSFLNNSKNIDAYNNPSKFNWSGVKNGYAGFKKAYDDAKSDLVKVNENIIKNKKIYSDYTETVAEYLSKLKSDYALNNAQANLVRSRNVGVTPEYLLHKSVDSGVTPEWLTHSNDVGVTPEYQLHPEDTTRSQRVAISALLNEGLITQKSNRITLGNKSSQPSNQSVYIYQGDYNSLTPAQKQLLKDAGFTFTPTPAPTPPKANTGGSWNLNKSNVYPIDVSRAEIDKLAGKDALAGVEYSTGLAVNYLLSMGTSTLLSEGLAVAGSVISKLPVVGGKFGEGISSLISKGSLANLSESIQRLSESIPELTDSDIGVAGVIAKSDINLIANAIKNPIEDLGVTGTEIITGIKALKNTIENIPNTPIEDLGVTGTEAMVGAKAIGGVISKIPFSTMAVTASILLAESERIRQNGIKQLLPDTLSYLGGAQGFATGFNAGKSDITRIERWLSEQNINYLRNDIIETTGLSAEELEAQHIQLPRKGTEFDVSEVTSKRLLDGVDKFAGFEGLDPTSENFKRLVANYTPEQLKIWFPAGSGGFTSMFSLSPYGSFADSLIEDGVTGGKIPLVWGAPSSSLPFLGEGEASFVAGVPDLLSRPNFNNITGLNDFVKTGISKNERQILSDVYNQFVDAGYIFGIMPADQNPEAQAVIARSTKNIFMRWNDQNCRSALRKTKRHHQYRSLYCLLSCSCPRQGIFW